MYCCPHCAHTRIAVFQEYRCLIELVSDPQVRTNVQSHVMHYQGIDMPPEAITTCLVCNRSATLDACKSAYTLHFGIFQTDDGASAPAEPPDELASAPAEHEGVPDGGSPD